MCTTRMTRRTVVLFRSLESDTSITRHKHSKSEKEENHERRHVLAGDRWVWGQLDMTWTRRHLDGGWWMGLVGDGVRACVSGGGWVCVCVCVGWVSVCRVCVGVGWVSVSVGMCRWV